MSETAQQTIFGDTLDTLVELEADGRVIRPWKRLIDPIADECRVHCDSDGLHVSVVDPANVIMVDATLYADALESYSVHEECTLGLNTSAFGTALQHARYGSSNSDTVHVQADDRTLETTVTKEIVDTSATFAEQMDLVNPDTIRQEPTLPNDLQFTHSVECSAELLREVLDTLTLKSKTYLELEGHGDTLTVTQEQDTTKRRVEIDADVAEGGKSLYTGDYWSSIKNQLTNGLIDSVRMEWAEDFPVNLTMEREGVYEARTFLAPRVRSE